MTQPNCSVTVLFDRGTPERLARRVLGGQGRWAWVYLGRDFSRLQAWRHALGSVAVEIPIGDKLQGIGEALRGPFLQWCADWGRELSKRPRDELAWWTSRIAERNNFCSPLFLRFCYLELLRAICQTNPGPLLIICESVALSSSVLKLAGSLGRPTRRAQRFAAGVSLASQRLVCGLRLGYLVVNAVRRLWVARRTARLRRRTGASSPEVWCTSFVAPSALKSVLRRDPYFGILPHWLAAQGFAVRTLPMVLMRCNFPAWIAAATSPSWIIREDYCGIADFLFALRNSLRQIICLSGRRTFLRMDVSSLIGEEKWQGAGSAATAEAVLTYRFLRAVARTGSGPAWILSTFENHITEKALYLGRKHHLPGCSIVAFQHGAMYPHWLCYALAPEEARFCPLPDRIITNGPAFRDILADRGFPRERLFVGCSLRYQDWLAVPPVIPSVELPLVVMVALPLDSWAALELLMKVHSAVAAIPGVRVWIRPHPMAPLEGLVRRAGWRELPSIYTADPPTSTPAMVITSASSYAVEALARGLPVIRVGRDTDLDMDCLAWCKAAGPVCRTVEHIRNRILEVIEALRSNARAFEALAKEVRLRYFAPVCDEALSVFLPERSWSFSVEGVTEALAELSNRPER